METKPSCSPVPSFTLQITRQDAELFLEACSALRASASDAGLDLSRLSHDGEPDTADEDSPFHQMLFTAADKCPNQLIRHFVAEKLGATNSKLGMLLFCNADLQAKLQYICSNVSSSKGETGLSNEEFQSVFRVILQAIAACTSRHQSKRFVVEGKPECQKSTSDRIAKKLKTEDDTLSTKALTDADPNELRSGCTSFDSSLETLKDDEGKEQSQLSLEAQINEVSLFAAEEIKRHVDKQSQQTELPISVVILNWFSSHGKDVIPWLELLDISKWQDHASKKESKHAESDAPGSPSSLLTEPSDSRAVLSFDFSDPGASSSVVVHITEDNIVALRNLVNRTGISDRSSEEMCRILLKLSPDGKTLSRETFRDNHHELFSPEKVSDLSSQEKEGFLEDLLDFFSLFETDIEEFTNHEADLRQLAMGFCFFSSGNKSTKLAVGFELSDANRNGYLSEGELLSYLQVYLSMLVMTSFLVPTSKRNSKHTCNKRRQELLQSAVYRGAKWTSGHFVKANSKSAHGGRFTFDSFANWYSMAGYNVAPWLELLDLAKVLALVPELSSPLRLPPLDDVPFSDQKSGGRDRVSSLRRHHSERKRQLTRDILFTFPLAARRSLIVLKDDATYVRQVVEKLSLSAVKPEHLWEAMTTALRKRRSRPTRQDGPEYVNMETFVQCVQEICPKVSRKRSHPGEISLSCSTSEILANFFQCFDLNQTDSVAIDELMGGLSLLCGGKKSTKLAFAFSIFDTRPPSAARSRSSNFVHSLSGEDLFLFLRSILIVTFSCCRQSLDMDDETVGRCIADTANMICNDVMRYQWESKQLDRLDFDEFGQWYNEGGFERAPWLELLDLQKWVMVDNFDSLEKKVSTASNEPLDPAPPLRLPDDNVPPPPPEDAIDGFFDENVIMPMDSMDEMDMILMQASTDKDSVPSSPKVAKSFAYSSPANASRQRGSALKFHLVTNEKHGGYMLSLSNHRIGHFRGLLRTSGLHLLDPEKVCNEILSKSSRSKISKQSFDLALESLCPGLKRENKTTPIWDILTDIFAVFDPDNTGRANALAVACGLTVLCQGKKSDKLEYAFTLLGRSKRGLLTKSDLAIYLQSFLSLLLTIVVSPVLESDGHDDMLSTIKGKPVDGSPRSIVRTVKAGASWATDLSFSNVRSRASSKTATMSFDDFAAWYTASGYSSIPWLELLDLRKWLFPASTSP